MSLKWGPRVVVATARTSDHRPGWRVDLPGAVSRDSWCHQRPDGPHLAFCRHNILKDSQWWLKLKACLLIEKGSGMHRFQKRKKSKNLWLLNKRKPSFMHWESLCSYLWMKCKTTALPFLDIKIIYPRYCASINTYYYFLRYLNCHVTHNNNNYFYMCKKILFILQLGCRIPLSSPPCPAPHNPSSNPLLHFCSGRGRSLTDINETGHIKL